MNVNYQKCYENAIVYLLIKEVKGNSDRIYQGRFTEQNSHFYLPLFDRAGLRDNQTAMTPYFIFH